MTTNYTPTKATVRIYSDRLEGAVTLHSERDGKEGYGPTQAGKALLNAMTAVSEGRSLPKVGIIDADLPIGVGEDRLVELHLEKVITALFEAVEIEAAKRNLHIIVPSFELFLKFTNSNS